MIYILRFLELLFEIYTIILLGRIIVSWFMPYPTSRLSAILFQITDPTLSVFRKFIPRIWVIDFSPVAAVLFFQGLVVIVNLLK